jgi:hypothetical protein
MTREPHIRFNKFRIFYVFVFVIVFVVFLINYGYKFQAEREVQGCSYCLDRVECPTSFNEQMLGDFVRIPSGYFTLPKHIKKTGDHVDSVYVMKTGYGIDSVYVNSFYLAVGKVSLDTYKSVYCSKEEGGPIRSLNNSINHLEQKQIGRFLFRVNQLSQHHYRIPNDVEWMYAYQYFETIGHASTLQYDQRRKVDLILTGLSQEPFEFCSWEGRRMKGDTISNFAFSEDLLSSKGQYITKGDTSLLYNRDVPAKSSGIRLVRY